MSLSIGNDFTTEATENIEVELKEERKQNQALTAGDAEGHRFVIPISTHHSPLSPSVYRRPAFSPSSVIPHPSSAL